MAVVAVRVFADSSPLMVSRCGSLYLTLGSIPNSADPMVEWVFCSVSLMRSKRLTSYLGDNQGGTRPEAG